MANTAVAAPAPKKEKHASQRTRRIVSDVVIYVILTVMAIVWILPILWILLQSFTGQAGASRSLWIPEIWDFEVVQGHRIIYNGQIKEFNYTLGLFGNYRFLFTNQAYANNQQTTSIYNFIGYVSEGQFYPGGFINTLILAVFCAVFSTLFTLMTSYAFSRLRFKGRQLMMRIIMILGMFPGFLGLIILYAFFYKILGVNVKEPNLWLLVVIYSGGAGMGYYISKGFFDTISKQIDEAAMIDGATRFQIFYKITIPLSKPIITYTILTSFMAPWAEYITASYMLGGQNPQMSNWTLPLILYDMIVGSDAKNIKDYWGQFCAGAIIIAVPTSILFMFMQKNYVGGVTGGAVKG